MWKAKKKDVVAYKILGKQFSNTCIIRYIYNVAANSDSFWSERETYTKINLLFW